MQREVSAPYLQTHHRKTQIVLMCRITRSSSFYAKYMHEDNTTNKFWKLKKRPCLSQDRVSDRDDIS